MMHAHHSGFRWLAIPAGILLVLGILWAFNHRKVGDTPIPNESTGELALIAEAREPVGDVTLIRDHTELAVTNHMPLEEGDVVRTGQGSVSLEFFAGSRVALDNGTEIEITTADLDTENPRVQQVSIALHAGRIWSRVLKLLDVNARFDVRGAALTATVRGTAFAMTSHPGVAGSDETLDLFDGRLAVAINGGKEGTLESGFTFIHGIGDEQQPFAAHVIPTPDDVRNDAFIRAQLREDATFLERVQPMRQQLNDLEPYTHIGQEVGAFTLNEEGATHSAYQYLEVQAIRPLTTALKTGESVSLSAKAYFYENGAMTRKDVSQEATWQVSNTAIATLLNDGTLTAKEGNGTVIVTARWNDGTHEHSGSIAVPIGQPLIEINPPRIDPSAAPIAR